MRQKDPSGRLARWVIKLQKFSFSITHGKGTQNVVADALSRVNEPQVNEFDDLGPIVDLTAKEFLSLQYTDLIENIRNNQERLPDLKVVDKFVYKRTENATGDPKQEQESWKPCIPNDLVPQILYQSHDAPEAAYCGMGKLVEKLRRCLFWSRMVTEIRGYVRKYFVCLATKNSNTVLRPPLGKPMESQRPIQNLYMDLLGPCPRSKTGNIGLLIILDPFWSCRMTLTLIWCYSKRLLCV